MRVRETDSETIHNYQSEIRKKMNLELWKISMYVSYGCHNWGISSQ